MTTSEVVVALDQPEYTGLPAVAVKELRYTSEQLWHILRGRLRQRGLLQASTLGRSRDSVNEKRNGAEEEL